MNHLLRLAAILILPGGFIVALYYFILKTKKKFGRLRRRLRKFFHNAVEKFRRL